MHPMTKTFSMKFPLADLYLPAAGLTSYNFNTTMIFQHFTGLQNWRKFYELSARLGKYLCYTRWLNKCQYKQSGPS